MKALLSQIPNLRQHSVLQSLSEEKKKKKTATRMPGHLSDLHYSYKRREYLDIFSSYLKYGKSVFVPISYI